MQAVISQQFKKFSRRICELTLKIMLDSEQLSTINSSHKDTQLKQL
jgi:hypothetical protein